MTAGETATAESRPLTLRKRSDLRISRQSYAGVPYFILKDPLTLRHCQLREEEFYLFELLDGSRSAEQLKQAFESRFAPRRLRYTQLQHFLSMLHRENLVVADAANQSEPLLQRRRRWQRDQFLAAVSNPLAIRFRGVNPQRFLNWLSPHVRWCFSAWAVTLWLLLVFSAVTLLMVEFDTWRARLPEFHAFFSAHNLPWFLLAIALSKVLHELGHGVACKHFGGECHEMGVMLLVMTPCLYANVSDAWMLPNKWRRIAISAAGMYTELGLAAACTFVWWFTNPGLLNSICLHLMFVCSVSSLLFNANPLLRYDGYFILSDLLEVPNLRARSTALVQRYLAGLFLGIELPGERMYPERHRGRIAAYAVAAVVYRLFVILAILWFCHAVLEPYGLAFAVQLLAVIVIGGLVARPIWQIHRFLSHPAWRRRVQWLRFLCLLTITAALLAGILSVPLPHRISAPAVLVPADARHIYVAVEGELAHAVEAGLAVEPGDELAKLVNPELERELVRLRGRKTVLQSQLESLKRRSAQATHLGVRDPGSQIPVTEQALADVEQQLARRLEEYADLTLRAPQAGQVIPPPSRPATSGERMLGQWSGTPLDPSSRGAFLETGTLLCLVGDPAKLRATLVIAQQDIEFVETGQLVYLQLDQAIDKRFCGEITEIADLDADTAPAELLATGVLPTEASPDGKTRLAGVYYQATVTLNNLPSTLLPGGVGRARIVAAPRSVGQRLLRYLDRTLRL